MFAVATCNDILQLQQNWCAKGRFDEIFFIDLPHPTEREAIFRIHLKKRGRTPEAFDLPVIGRRLRQI